VDGDAPRVRRFGVIGVFVVVANGIVEIADADGAGADFRSQRCGRVSEDRPILGDTLAALRDSTGCAQVEGGVVRSPVAVADQQHGGQVRACGKRLQIPVDNHRAL